MAIAFNTSTQGKVNAGTSSLTISHTASGSNRIAIIGVVNQNATSGIVTGVTYGGVACTNVINNVQAGSGARLSIWYFIAPSTSATNVVISRSNTSGALYGQVLSYTGASQTTQPDSSDDDGGTGNVTSRTATATSVANNIWAAAVAYNDNGNLAAGTNSTARGTLQDSLFRMFDNSGVAPITPASTSYSMEVTGNSGGMGIAMVGITPFVVNYDLVAEVGSFTLTGQDADLLAQRKLVAEVGSFVLTGFDAILRKGYIIAAEVGTFALTGFDAALLFARKLIAETGSFVLTGFDASLNKGYRMMADAGEFVLTFFGLGGWIGMQKNSSTWENGGKNSSTWNNGSKNSSTWSNTDKNS
jgi:hypothetical protein